ncbi:MAG: PH domain-containing protein [Mediterranea sp.]|nr:PH domain-containing protein [Mediterranea sp.]
MNRIFHARIAWYQYFLLAILTANVVVAFWVKAALVGLLLALLLLVVIERVVHTVYTITSEGTLVVDVGRFARKRVIPIADITAIERYRSMKFGSFSVTNYLLIHYAGNKFVSVMPVKEEEFLEALRKKGERGVV